MPGTIPGMNIIRKAVLAAALMAGIAPAFAQVPPPVPALPDTERRTSYTISASACNCAVGFQIYGDSTDYTNWIEVWLNGVQVTQSGNWTITSPTGSLASIPRPITDAVLTFTSARTGTVQIVGARRPRRTSQFAENRGVAARDLNQVISDLVAQNREVWDKTNDVTGRAVLAPPGETLAILASAANRKNQGACFDNSGNLSPCVGIPGSSFTAGNGITFTGVGPTQIAANIAGVTPIVVTPGQPTQISCPTCAVYNVPTFNLASFGAVSGADTGLRNSNAIANAIAACSAAGSGMIWVPAGNYLFATAATFSTSNCGMEGEGQGASILTYTGTGSGITIGPALGANIVNITFRSLQVACNAACARAINVRDVEQSIVFDNVQINAGSTGNESVRVTSNTPTTGGSYSVHFVNGTVINNCLTICLSVNPGGAGLAQAIFIDHVFFNGYAQYALLVTSGSGIFMTNTRVERHPGTGNTNPAIHVDTTSKVAIRNNYIEDEANATQIEIGAGVQALDIVGNYFTINVSAGIATSAGAIKHNGSTPAPTMVNIKENTFIGAGTIGKMVDFSAVAASQIHFEYNYVNMGNGTIVVDFGSSVRSTALFNTISVGTVSKGLSSAIGLTALDVAGNSSSGTYTTTFSDVDTSVLCAGVPSGSFTTNYAGRVTHC
jgi:hypothetical protein